MEGNALTQTSPIAALFIVFQPTNHLETWQEEDYQGSKVYIHCLDCVNTHIQQNLWICILYTVQGRDWAQRRKCLPNKHKVLSSILSYQKKKKKKTLLHIHSLLCASYSSIKLGTNKRVSTRYNFPNNPKPVSLYQLIKQSI